MRSNPAGAGLVYGPGGGGGGTPLYGLYRYVRPQRVWFSVLRMGYRSRPFWSEIGSGFCTLVLTKVCF